MRGKRFRALIVAAGLAAWSGLVAPRLPKRVLVPLHAVSSTALVAATRTPLGLRPPALWRGIAVGTVAAAVVSVSIAATTTLPRVRGAMAERALPASVAGWLLVHIPVGTVWSEEAAFRGALGNLAAEAFGPKWGTLLQATTFGLSHVADARAAEESVVGTVVVTGVAGWLFGRLYARSGSLAASVLAHLAINEAGAIAAIIVGRRQDE